MKKKFSIVMIASEVAPYSMTGGLGQIIRALPIALHSLGHHVSIITPLYQSIPPDQFNLKSFYRDVPISMDEHSQTIVHFWKGEFHEKKIPIYFVEHRKSFSGHNRLYGSKFDNERFWLFNVACLKLLSLLKEPIDVIHCHDWQSGLIPFFIQSRYRKNEIISSAATLFTIHNLAFQLGGNWWGIPLKRKDDGRRALPDYRDHDRVRAVNFAKRGILYASATNTVSEQYAKEIMTKEYGQHLHSILKNKAKNGRLFGIVNGIDVQAYNPETDPGLYRNFSVRSLHKKEANKRALQRKYQLPQPKHTPIICMVTRIAEQKGFDLLMEIIPFLIHLNLQLIIFGGGDKQYEEKLRSIHKKYPKKIGIHLEFNREDSTKVFAGSDLFLMPSRFEPCGITQLESMRYGSIPIVREVGGLVDTVTDYSPITKRGNGFVFSQYNHIELFVAIIRALETYKREGEWKDLVKRVMLLSHSWKLPAKKYISLYRKVQKLRSIYLENNHL